MFESTCVTLVPMLNSSHFSYAVRYIISFKFMFYFCFFLSCVYPKLSLMYNIKAMLLYFIIIVFPASRDAVKAQKVNVKKQIPKNYLFINFNYY